MHGLQYLPSTVLKNLLKSANPIGVPIKCKILNHPSSVTTTDPHHVLWRCWYHLCYTQQQKTHQMPTRYHQPQYLSLGEHVGPVDNSTLEGYSYVQFKEKMGPLHYYSYDSNSRERSRLTLNVMDRSRK